MDDQNLYFVFENCENGDLNDLITKRKTLSLEVTRIYAAQMVQCLYYLQKKGVMHRDLKPQNILLDANMNLKFVSNTQRLKFDRLTSVMLRKLGKNHLKKR